jgi:hypothetical protein
MNNDPSISNNSTPSPAPYRKADEGLSEQAAAIATYSASSLPPVDLTEQEQDRQIDEFGQGNNDARLAMVEMQKVAPMLGLSAQDVPDILSSLNLKGPNLASFYDVCNFDGPKAVGVLWASRKGLVEPSAIHQAIAGVRASQPVDFPVNDLFQKAVDYVPGPNERPKLIPEDLISGYRQLLARRDRHAAPDSQKFFHTDGRPKVPFSPAPPRAARHEERITTDDNLLSAITKLAGTEEVAVRILFAATVMAPKVDPDHWAGAMSPLIRLDSLGIYGKDIVSLHKACEENAAVMVSVLKARSDGVVTIEKIKKVISTLGQPEAEKLDLDGIREQLAKMSPESLLAKDRQASLPAIPDASKIPEASGHQPDHDQEKKQGGDGK